MPQFDFYGTSRDAWQNVQDILAIQGVSAITDIWYEHPEPHVYAAVTDAMGEELETKRRIFLVRPGVRLSYRHGLVQQRSGPKAGLYRVAPRELGEVLELTLPVCFEREAELWLSSGSLFCAPEFLEAEAEIWRKPSAEHKAFYRDVLRVIKASLRRVKLPSSTRWLGPEALCLLQGGRARIADRG